MIETTGIDLPALLHGPHCSSLESRDLAIMIEDMLDDAHNAATQERKDLVCQLDEVCEERDDAVRISGELAEALLAVISAHDRMVKEREDTVAVGVLVVAGPMLQRASEDLLRAIDAARRVHTQWDDGEL